MGFPHSDTHGSTLFWQLTVLFRGLIRPSSPVCPKAFTSCPESLIIKLELEISFYSSPIRRSLKSSLLTPPTEVDEAIRADLKEQIFLFVFLIFPS
jgi:hypothetical protein